MIHADARWCVLRREWDERTNDNGVFAVAGADVMAELISLSSINGRVCPKPIPWNELWRRLPNRKRTRSGWEPPSPLESSVWERADALEKRTLLLEHFKWAERQGVLDEIARFVRGLSENQWLHDT
jgi:hypothetical protein